jgi:hypothetical protein
MQRVPFTKKRTAFGIALIIAGLVFLDRTSFWRGFQAPYEDKLLFLSTIFIGSSVIVLGGAVIGGMQAKTFLKGLLIFGLWTFVVALPILLLPLSEEITILSVSFSFLPPILLYICYVELRKKHMKGTEKGGK